MNVLFLTLLEFDSLKEHSIYTDLLREFSQEGHKIYAISPIEKRHKQRTHVIYDENAVILRLRIGNIQKTNIIEKGISTVLIGPAFKKAVKKYFKGIKLDLVLYSTPPITFVSTISEVKKRDGAMSYLLLKDIFPQNAIDIGIMSTFGLRGILYKHFRKQEQKLYRVSDVIGCMSPANVKYLLQHNTEINNEKVEVCPNSISVIDKSVNPELRAFIRSKYAIPNDKKVFVYGGNLGKPQGIPFMIQCLQSCSDLKDVLFLIVGDGTEYGLVCDYIEREHPENVMLMKRLPKEDYDTLVGACDVGLIFLDHRFTIPNFPSRLLSYMQAKLPILAVTDPNTDIGRIIESNEFGWWCESDNAGTFKELVKRIAGQDCSIQKNNAWQYLNREYSAKKAYQVIHKWMK